MGLEYKVRKPKPMKTKIIEIYIDTLEMWAVKKIRTFDERKYNIVHLNRNNQLYKIQHKVAQ